MKDLPIEKAERIIKHYGTQHQLVILAEECSELIKEACKCIRSGKQ